MAAFPEYENYDGLGLAKLIAKRDVNAEEILDAAIERIEAHNPSLNAVVHKMYDEARATIAAGLPDSPLAGVPFLLKDLNLFYAGQPLSNGSKLFKDFIPDHDATLTERYKAAGLVIMGKTNTPEMGIAMATEPVLHGPTRNPWNTDYSAAGSSGGAAAAVASGMLPLAHATDGGGSIRMPASNCGLFGLKPSRARNPIGPDVGEGWSGLGVAHCVSRSVRDSAALLDLTQGPAPGDPYAVAPPTRPFLDEVGADAGRLKIALMASAPNNFPLHPDCRAGVEAAAELCQRLGHAVEEKTFDYDFEQAKHAMWAIIACNVRNMLALGGRLLGREPTVDDVEQITWLCSEDGRQYSGSDYALAVQSVHAIGRQLGHFFENYDVLLSPVMAQPPLKLGVINMMGDDLDAYNDTMMSVMPFTPLFNMTGCPAMSVPLHWSNDDLPIGIQFGTRFGNEAALFRLAAQLEHAQPWFERRPRLTV